MTRHDYRSRQTSVLSRLDLASRSALSSSDAFSGAEAFTSRVLAEHEARFKKLSSMMAGDALRFQEPFSSVAAMTQRLSGDVAKALGAGVLAEHEARFKKLSSMMAGDALRFQEPFSGVAAMTQRLSGDVAQALGAADDEYGGRTSDGDLGEVNEWGDALVCFKYCLLVLAVVYFLMAAGGMLAFTPDDMEGTLTAIQVMTYGIYHEIMNNATLASLLLIFQLSFWLPNKRKRE